MKPNDLIGLTIAESLPLIKAAEKGRFFQYYAIEKKTKEFNYFNADKNIHYHDKNGKRAYRVVLVDSLIFAKDINKENDSFIIDVEIIKGVADNWSFNGYESSTNYNIYYLFVDHLQKDNKGYKEQTKKEQKLIAYKDGELTKKQRRFTL